MEIELSDASSGRASDGASEAIQPKASGVESTDRCISAVYGPKRSGSGHAGASGDNSAKKRKLVIASHAVACPPNVARPGGAPAGQDRVSAVEEIALIMLQKDRYRCVLDILNGKDAQIGSTSVKDMINRLGIRKGVFPDVYIRIAIEVFNMMFVVNGMVGSKGLDASNMLGQIYISLCKAHIVDLSSVDMFGAPFGDDPEGVSLYLAFLHAQVYAEGTSQVPEGTPKVLRRDGKPADKHDSHRGAVKVCLMMKYIKTLFTKLTLIKEQFADESMTFLVRRDEHPNGASVHVL